MSCFVALYLSLPVSQLAFVLDRQTAQCVHQLLIYRLIILNRLGERHIYYFIILYAYHHVSLIVQKGIDSCRSHS